MTHTTRIGLNRRQLIATGAATLAMPMLITRPALAVTPAEIRSRGYAITHGQKIEGAVGIGAPIFNSERRAIGSLCMTIPETRFSAKAQTRLSELLMSRAGELSRALGYEPLPQAAE